jgi:hypothetical protein
LERKRTLERYPTLAMHIREMTDILENVEKSSVWSAAISVVKTDLPPPYFECTDLTKRIIGDSLIDPSAVDITSFLFKILGWFAYDGRLSFKIFATYRLFK